VAGDTLPVIHAAHCAIGELDAETFASVLHMFAIRADTFANCAMSFANNGLSFVNRGSSFADVEHKAHLHGKPFATLRRPFAKRALCFAI
jgi:hypothetical protein